jgi:hypothetical protein
MAKDKPCAFACGRWGRLTSDICATCAGNQGRWKKERPAQRIAYRQRLALATRRQTSYAEELGDSLQIPDLELDDKPKIKAKVIKFGPHLKRRTTAKRKRA